VKQEAFPSKPITMVIDQGPGGQNDVMTRAVSKAAEKVLGQPIICENRPGGGMIVARNYVLKSKPDGYTLGTGGSYNTVTWPHMQKLPFKYEIAPLVLAFILGPLAENAFRQCLIMSQGNYFIFLSRPFPLIALTIALFLFASQILPSIRKRRRIIAEIEES